MFVYMGVVFFGFYTLSRISVCILYMCCVLALVLPSLCVCVCLCTCVCALRV